jgi:polar amino acid transport system substrate-binding protein
MRRLLVLIAVSLTLALPALADEPLRMLYFDRPPYYVAGKLEPHGLLVERTNKIAAAAGLRAEWHEASAKRIIEVIIHDLEPACSPGWFMTEERANAGRFTAPIYRDPPQALLLPKHSTIPTRFPDIEAILADPSVRVLVKAGFSYGAQVDALLKDAKARVQPTTAKTAQMARMVAGGRADFLFITGDEGRELVTSDPDLRGLEVFAPKGLTLGGRRHILCSRAVDPATVARLSKAAEDLYKIAP